MDLESDSLEPVAPFELLTLTESVINAAPLQPLIPEISQFSPPSSTLTPLPSSGLISQSVELINTMFSAEETAISSSERGTTPLDVLENAAALFSPPPAYPPVEPPMFMEAMPMFCARVREASSSLYRLDAGRVGGMGAEEEEPGVVLEAYATGSLSLDVENGSCHFPLDSIATLVSPKKHTTTLHLPLPHADPVPFIHRSVSSPVFAASIREHPINADDSDATIILNGNTPAKPKKRKAVTTSLQLPEAEPPAVLPRFQWFQGKGMVKVHVLIKNVCPMNMKLKCNGRDLEVRCSTDNAPFPPTKPLNPPRDMVDYHLPLRLAHRVHPEPEFIRYSPSRIEVHYRKVKPYIEWASLWKNPAAASATASWSDSGVMDVETSSDSDEVDEEDEDEDMERPAKRFMNGEIAHAGEKIPLPPLPEIPGPLTMKVSSPLHPAHFTLGLNEPDSDQTPSTSFPVETSAECAMSTTVAIVVSEWNTNDNESVVSTTSETHETE
ncbi:uncharacterized protein LOC129586545 [Paramacrobiotus metropolitanus]|uniref:uncharacterized protein LOC129586545 n=1 Tax=Paramacrobiotus metropolitanus TaxID=2943436 RepID=UPI00244608CD|nr:uncharacterized protein LOC129586545 [Paramacrobiotus metropolitanus]